MQKWLLTAVLVLAFFLRTLWLDRFPVGFTPDEASFGYDAYSILKTGKDQWGKPFPLVLESFGDFKSPLYAYLTVPSVAAFGLDKFAVRLPNAILGTLAVLAAYLLTTKLLNRKAGLISALLLTVSPWHIMLSRGAFEANLITFFIPFAVYLWLTERHNLSAILFGLSLFAYHSTKIITPIVFVTLFLVPKKKKLLPAIVFSLFFILMLYSMKLGGSARISERSITAGALEEGAKVKIELIQNGMNPVVARLLHNKYQVTAKRFVANYKQYFSLRFLFLKGPAETTYGMLPGTGVLYLFEGILLLGLIPALKKKENKIPVLFLTAWLFLSPVPAAFSTGVGYSANRAVVMIPVIQILEAFGALGWYGLLVKLDRRFLFAFPFVLAFLASGSFVKFKNLYFKDSPKTAARGMLYGNLEAADWLKENKGERKVVVSRSLSEPHIYIAFVNKWDPINYQESTKEWNYKEQDVNWVDQMSSYMLGDGDYVIQAVDWKKNTGKPNTLLVGRPGEFLESAVPEKIIYYPDGTPAVYMVDSDATQLYAKAD